MPDVLFILLLALVIFGPRKLPEMARQLGKYMAEFRRLKSELSIGIESEIRRVEMEESSGRVSGSPQGMASKVEG